MKGMNMNRAKTILTVFLGLSAAVQGEMVTNLVQNGGFEVGISGNLPNPDTALSAYWFTDESANGQLVSEATITNSGAVAVSWEFYFAAPSLIQKLGSTVEAGKNYEIDFWHAIGEPSVNAAHTNATEAIVSIWTSPTVGGTYTEAISKSGIASTSGAGVYENYIGTFAAAELAGRVGEYIQLRVKKDLPNSHYRLFVDDVSFGPQVPTGPATLITSPLTELALTFGVAGAASTGTVAVSYAEGIPPTNVTITAVSVVYQSHAGAFSNVTALPLALNNPAPASELLSIVFDNSVGGLAAGETATGVVEIVWNEVGSASSSTSSLPISATFLEVNDSNIIAVFDNAFINADRKLQGLVAKISGGLGSVTTQGSTDTTYGTLTGLAPAAGGGYKATLAAPTVVVAITNDTGYDVTFDSLHFDIGRQFAKGPNGVNVAIAGDITNDPSITNHIGFSQFAGTTGDYDDFDVDLTGLADHTLAHGEAASFEFTFGNGDLSNTNAVSTIDNIALIGSGSNGASLTKAPGGSVFFGVTGLDTGASELIEMAYTAGDAATNVTINSITFSEESHPGAFGYSGTLPLLLADPVVTNEICTLLFDNTDANLAAGETASALLTIAWNEAGLGARIFEFAVSAARPAATPTNTVIALFDTAFLIPDAAANGVLGSVNGSSSVDPTMGSNDGTYGTLASPAAPTAASCFSVLNNAPVVTMSITNQTVADIVLSVFHFDIGRRFTNSPEGFTLSVSGDLSNDPALLVASNLTVVGNIGDCDDFDVDLTGLADHTLAQGESAVFTFTFDSKVDFPFSGTSLDNFALTGVFDTFGGWAADVGLTLGVNDDPNDNPDNDGKDNLMEFATGGDPLVADGPAAESFQTAEGGTNWFYHVHTERTDDPGLSYSVGAKDNLLYSPEWIGTNVEYVGESSGPGLFKSVTNRTDMGSTAEFIRLKVDKN